MGIAFSHSLLSYKLNGKPKPFSASFVVSNNCNIHCSYCSFPTLKSEELTLPQIDKLFNNLKKLGVRRLGLLGGEPLFRKDILEIISLAKKKEFFISLNSNLLMYEKFKGKLGQIDYFFTSLDGRPETHIKNRGKQSFDKIIEAIKDIRLKGKKVTAICVVNGQSKEDIEYLVKLAKESDFTLHFQPECFDSEYVANSAPTIDELESFKKVWQFIGGMKKAGAPITSSLAYLDYISKWEDFSISALFDPAERCAAGRGYLLVDVKGYGYPCAFTKGKTEGINLLENDWSIAFNKKTPCTKCIVGPMLEFNTLFRSPVGAISNIIKNIY